MQVIKKQGEQAERKTEDAIHGSKAAKYVSNPCDSSRKLSWTRYKLQQGSLSKTRTLSILPVYHLNSTKYRLSAPQEERSMNYKLQYSKLFKSVNPV